MGQALSCSFMRSFVDVLAGKIMSEKDHLDSLDAACGDGDFGIGMYLGFKNVQETIEEQADNDIGTLLVGTGRAILDSIGGASGPLFGTLFIEMGEKAKGKTGIGLGDLAVMFEAGLEKIRQRGKASAGDKTLVDALEPATGSLADSALREVGMLPALEAAAQAATRGCESTSELVARHGKARYLGEQTLGHIDPGAYVVRIIFETFASTYSSSGSD